MPMWKFSRRVSIFRAAQTNDFETGQPLPSLVCEAWADIVPLNGTERANAQQVYANATTKIIIRWPFAEVRSQDYVETSEARYEIQSVTDIDGKGDYLELICTAPQGTGKVTTR